MTVYVDDMFKLPMGKFYRMKMSHMVATDWDELHEMAQAVGVRRKWFQGDHYDVCMTARAQAIGRGAIEITTRQMGMMSLYRGRHKQIEWPTIEEAEKWWNERIKNAPNIHL